MPARTAQTAHRVLDFLLGLSDLRARRALEGHGFGDAALAEGWRRLMALSSVPFVASDPPAAGLPSELDEWENLWFPIADVVLRTSHPRVHEVVFRNLRQTEGAQVLISVRVLLDRLELVGRPEDEGGLGEQGREALAHLADRGLTEEVVERARALLDRVAQPPPDDEPVADPEARDRAEAHLWTWYLEWSGIARAVIKDRRVLASLGFGSPGRRRKE